MILGFTFIPAFTVNVFIPVIREQTLVMSAGDGIPSGVIGGSSMVPEGRISAYRLNFTGSTHWGLREYGKGEVREGAGMGGMLNLAGKLLTHDDLLSRIDEGYTQIAGKED